MIHKRKFKLGPFVLIVLVTLLSVIGISVAVISYLTAKQQIQVTIKEDFKRDKRVVINVLTDELELITSAIEIFSTSKELSIRAKDQKWALLEDHLYEAISKFDGAKTDILLITDRHGALKGNAGNLIDNEQALIDWYAPHIVSKAWWLIGKTDKFLLRSMPITDDEIGEVVGHIVYGINLKNNFTLVQSLRRLTGIDGLALYVRGEFQAGAPSSEKREMQELGAKFDSLKKDTVIEYGDDNYGYVTSVDLFEGGGLEILFAQNTKAFYALNKAYQKDLIWIGLMIVVSGLFVMFVFQHFVIQPARQLANFARSTQGDQQTVPYTPIFIAEFDSAAIVVQRAFQELQKSKVNLEDLVEKRTHELAMEKERAENFLAIAGAIIVALDTKGAITLINNKGCEVLGYDMETIMGLNWFDLVIPDEQQELAKPIFSQIMWGDVEQVEHYENEVVTRTGERRFVSWHNTYVKDPNGFLTGVLSAGIDITEERKTQEALQEAFKFNETILADSPVGVLIFDTDGTCLSTNQAAADIVGATPEQLLQKNYHELETWKENGLYELAQEVLSSGNKSRREVHSTTTFGRDAVMECYLSPISISSKTHLLIMISDITETRHMQTQLIQSSKMATLGEMATGVAHELNQPLNVIRLAVNNIQRRVERKDIDPQYLTTKLNKVTMQVERAAAIIDHMRIFGRQSTGNMIALSPADMVKASLGLIGEQLRLSNIEIILELDEEDCLILGHQVQVEQVLLNLLSNARDALNDEEPAQKRIIVRVRKSDPAGSILIEVEDSGGGISVDHISRIFEPFFTTKEVGQGTGLGLSISYGIVNDMGGTLKVSNRACGACFEIALPVLEQEPQNNG